ncbi:ATP-binding protein [Pseudooceanicola aestuarii]|uniref:ATP-binding protein n=1 Tax=Pseudooceanicola aestuarii TaxID=2697319 RepID=UPI0013D699E0|nr:DUF4143 domain-containing protein [Pseudooceanicola aestuarii]
MPELRDSLATARVVNLVGPRQVGKTTLVRDLFRLGRFITLDDAAILAAMEADPEGQLTALAEVQPDTPVIIDEAQRSPKLALAIKKIVERNRRKGQFVLTGAEVNRAPASRLIDWAMQPVPRLAQIADPAPLGRKDYAKLILMGGYPEIRALPLRSRQRQYRDYIDAVVERDVADVMPVRKPDALRFLIDQMAARTAQEINTSELAKLAKLKRETVDQYLDVLMRLSLVIKLGAWIPGESKRDIKQPKFHFVDTGVAAALRRLNERSFDIGNSPEALGGLLESFVVGELQRALPLQDEDYRLYHWRSADRREIDVLIDGGHRLVGGEVKAATSVAAEDFKHLKWFAKDGPGKGRSTVGIVFYLGQDKLTLGDGNFALPVSALWSAADPG